MRNVVILGMHRSGTSMVAGALASAGIYVGDKAELLAVQEDNPTGFWERSDLVACNEEILSASAGSWYQPPAQLITPDADCLASMASISTSTTLGRADTSTAARAG